MKCRKHLVTSDKSKVDGIVERKSKDEVHEQIAGDTRRKMYGKSERERGIQVTNDKPLPTDFFICQIIH